MLGIACGAKKLYISVWGSDVFEFPQTSFFHKKLLTFILSKADKLFSTSKIMAVETQKYTSKSIEVIPFGVDTQQFSPQPKTKNNYFVIGTVKTLENIYGIDRLIEATIRLHTKHPQIQCHIYGSGSLKNEFDELIAKNNATSYVFLKGAIPHSEVPNVMNQLDVFCNLSRQESFGVAVLEALSCQTPVVVTNVGGLVEVVDDKKNGFICQENTDDICQKLEMLLQDETLRQMMGKNGRDWVLQQYNWHENLKKMLTFYHQ
jgi:glycosyltransferase involved in cell wall biosynthesis